MDRFDRMSEAEFALHLHKLETEWRPIQVHGNYVEKWVVCKFGAPTERTFYAPGSFTSRESALEAARDLNYADALQSSARTAGWGV